MLKKSMFILDCNVYESNVSMNTAMLMIQIQFFYRTLKFLCIFEISFYTLQ